MSTESARKRAAREQRERLARQERRRVTAWISAGAVVVLLLVGIIGYGVYLLQRPNADAAVPKHATADGTGVTVGTGPVKVELFIDYLCPACRAFETSADSTLKGYVDSGRITIVYHPVAILDDRSTNQYSSRAAAGAGCASDLDKMYEYTTALYADQPAENGPGHTNAELIEIAAAAGIPKDSFGACVNDGKYVDWAQKVNESIIDRRITGTPTVVVNGKTLTQNSLQELKAAIDAG